MTYALLLFFALAQPDADECMDRRPGLSKCVEYKREAPGRVTCKAVCYTRKPVGKGNDGGTDASITNGAGATEAACKADLEGKCRP